MKIPQEFPPKKTTHHPHHPGGSPHASAPFFRGTGPGISLFPSLDWSLAGQDMLASFEQKSKIWIPKVK